MKFLLFGLVLLSLNSCIEIIDDITVKNDGTGTFKYTINLSSSKVKANSVLALDSLNGQKVPSIADIQEKINFYKDKLEKKDGISNVKVDANFSDFIFKFQCDFQSVQQLQKAIRDILGEENKNWVNYDYNWISWDGNKLSRSNPKMPENVVQKLKADEIEGLKKGSYISISRFERPIEKTENPNSQISANKLAVMIKTNPYSLTQNTELLENTIYLSGMRKEVKY